MLNLNDIYFHGGRQDFFLEFSGIERLTNIGLPIILPSYYIYAL